MKHLLFLIIIGLFISCQFSKENSYAKSMIETENQVNIPEIKPIFVNNLSQLKESKFPNNKCDTIDNIDFVSLPPIENIDDFTWREGKYVCNRTYNDNFKTYILSVYEGGDYGPMTILYNCKKDSVLDSKMIYQVGSCENNYEHKYSTVFLNDSTFVITLKSQSMAMDSMAYLPDSLDYSLKTEQYEIASNGGFRLINETKRNWRTKK
ncbi:MAG: hypothetical protein M0P66_03100 [Salinivirgaceae bacterium]|nr:hypothetical protein [Salinivirgaceae bacterium]